MNTKSMVIFHVGLRNSLTGDPMLYTWLAWDGQQIRVPRHVVATVWGQVFHVDQIVEPDSGKTAQKDPFFRKHAVKFLGYPSEDSLLLRPLFEQDYEFVFTGADGYLIDGSAAQPMQTSRSAPGALYTLNSYRLRNYRGWVPHSLVLQPANTSWDPMMSLISSLLQQLFPVDPAYVKGIKLKRLSYSANTNVQIFSLECPFPLLPAASRNARIR